MKYPGIRLAAWIVGVLLLAGSAGAGEGTAYGEPLAADETVSIAELLTHPEDYVGKIVRVEGKVTGVCPKMGCWMTLASDEKGAEEIRIKVKDGVIVFPMEAEGRPAAAEGVFTKIEMTLQQTVRYLKHQAEEVGTEFDAALVTEPITLYEIRGTGAVIR